MRRSVMIDMQWCTDQEAGTLTNGDVISAPTGVANWNGPYWKKGTLPKDPWQNEYKYTSPGSSGAPYEIISLGADGRDGGEGSNADISSAKL